MRDLSHLQQQTSRLVLSLPGLSTAADCALGQVVLRGSGWGNGPSAVVDNAWSALVGGILAKAGICAFAGLNSAVFVSLGDLTLGKPYKFDGWGPVIGDYGSAFALSSRFLRSIGRMIDQGLTTPLAGALLKEYPEIRSIEDIPHWFDAIQLLASTAWKSHFDRIANLIVQAAESDQPEPTACKLIHDTAREMAETIGIAIRRFDNQDLPVVCQGNLFRSSTLYYMTVKQYLLEHFTNPVVRGAYAPIVGTLLLALGHGRTIPPDHVIENVLASLFDLPGSVVERLAISATSKSLLGEAT